MTAEQIAEVIADIRAGRVKHHVPDPAINSYLLDRARLPQPVVDATAVYKALIDRATGQGVNMYDDFPTVASPWDEALVAYVSVHGNVIVLQTHAEPWADREPWETTNPVDWGRVRWLVEAAIWVGGRDGTGRPLSTQGPAHLLQHAVYDDGSAADLHWVALLGRHNDQTWQMPLVTLNATLNFLACSNVEIAEPKRPFPVRQRLRKTRVQVQTIVVRPPGKRSRPTGEVRPVDELDTTLTTVRGSFARYGPAFDRGLLFGKYAGKFWRPAYVRGAGDPEQKDYLLKPGRAA